MLNLCAQGTPRSFVVLETEADLHAHLVVTDRICGAREVVGDVSADLRDLEPVEVAKGARGAVDAVADGLVDPVRRGADDLGDSVGAV